uniref:Uncharacterized protein n=1 Tax=Romanomermis culicivorax TaxID=13658 RepID=A0A915I1P2_ROMCU
MAKRSFPVSFRWTPSLARKVWPGLLVRQTSLNKSTKKQFRNVLDGVDRAWAMA